MKKLSYLHTRYFRLGCTSDFFQAKLSDTKEMFEAYEALVSKLVQEELNNLPRGVYHLSQAMKNRLEEHPNYNFLPETSILRAIINHFLTPSRPIGKSII